MPTLTDFELPADGIERAKKFYTNLFNGKLRSGKDFANNMEY